MALFYSLANLDGQFRARCPGYGYSANTYYRDYATWSRTSMDTTLGTLRAARLQAQQLQNEQAVLNNLPNMAQTSDGRMQSLQVLGQTAGQQFQPYINLRELTL